MDILLETGLYPTEISWFLMGTPCYYVNYPITTLPNSVQTKTCNLSPGEYTLVCDDSSGDGWNGAQLTIQGVKYCDNFDQGSVMMVQVNITGDFGTPVNGNGNAGVIEIGNGGNNYSFNTL